MVAFWLFVALSFVPRIVPWSCLWLCFMIHSNEEQDQTKSSLALAMAVSSMPCVVGHDCQWKSFQKWCGTVGVVWSCHWCIACIQVCLGGAICRLIVVFLYIAYDASLEEYDDTIKVRLCPQCAVMQPSMACNNTTLTLPPNATAQATVTMPLVMPPMTMPIQWKCINVCAAVAWTINSRAWSLSFS